MARSKNCSSSCSISVAENLDGAFQNRLFSVNSQRFSSSDNDPNHFAERHALVGPSRTNLHVALLKVKLILADEPLPQMVVDSVHLFFSSSGGTFFCNMGQSQAFYLIEKAAGQRLGMGFDRAERADRASS